MTNLPARDFLGVVDKDRIGQVFDNVIQNALEAYGGCMGDALCEFAIARPKKRKNIPT